MPEADVRVDAAAGASADLAGARRRARYSSSSGRPPLVRTVSAKDAKLPTGAPSTARIRSPGCEPGVLGRRVLRDLRRPARSRAPRRAPRAPPSAGTSTSRRSRAAPRATAPTPGGRALARRSCTAPSRPRGRIGGDELLPALDRRRRSPRRRRRPSAARRRSAGDSALGTPSIDGDAPVPAPDPARLDVLAELVEAAALLDREHQLARLAAALRRRARSSAPGRSRTASSKSSHQATGSPCDRRHAVARLRARRARRASPARRCRSRPPAAACRSRASP